MSKTASYIRRARLVKEIVDSHYVQGAHRGCLRYVWRVYVRPIYPMSEVTFYRYVEFMQGVDGFVGKGPSRVEKPIKITDPLQLDLFDLEPNL